MSLYTHTQRLFVMRCTLQKMLQRRGYIIPSELVTETQATLDALYLSLHDAAHAPSDNDLIRLSFTVTRPSPPPALPDSQCESLVVFFPNDTLRVNLGIAPIRHYVALMQQTGCARAILVLWGSLTAPAVAMLRDLELKGLTISGFTESELMVDIYEHEKVPLHVPLTVEEKAAVLAQFRADERQLPEIQRHDPMARYLGLKVGDVVRIHRVSSTVGHDIYYRIVVNSEDFN
jgi:DNA-directed RNA polymerase I, II, and III subunit RPABC1